MKINYKTVLVINACVWLLVLALYQSRESQLNKLEKDWNDRITLMKQQNTKV